MGQDYPCGCRMSAGAYWLCPFHEKCLDSHLGLVERDKEYRSHVQKENKKLRKMI